MSERAEVIADDKLAGVIWQTYGMAAAFDALGGTKPKSTLPGFALALALVEKELAEQRAIMSGAVYRAAARAGHDISKVSSIFTTIKNSKPQIEVEFADLVEQAETDV